jgi:hypothetical protein
MEHKRTGKFLIITLIFLGTILSGCSYTEMIRKDSLNITPAKISNELIESTIIYAISFEQLDTVLRIKKFAMQSLDKNEMVVKHGLAYPLMFDEMTTSNISELTLILKRHNFDSIEQFIEYYSSQKSIFPKSDFIALPANLGTKLFYLAQRARFDSPDRWISN